ncbi:MAG: hypothetical protein ABJO36_09460 [Litorimonas sp.]
MSYWLKICGLRYEADAKFCVSKKVNAIGMLIARSKESKTYKDILSWENAKNIAQITKQSETNSVLLCHIEDVSLLSKAVEYIQPDALQIQFKADLFKIAELRNIFPNTLIVQTLRAKGQPAEELKYEIESTLGEQNAQYVIVDSQIGGSGHRYDWGILNKIPEEFLHKRVIIAGGIHAANIVDAQNTINPFGFDIMSGAREKRGVLDYDKVTVLTNLCF